MSTDIQERVSHFQKFSQQTLARFCAELEREKLQLDFEWQDEFEELQRATAALREENARLKRRLVDHDRYDNIQEMERLRSEAEEQQQDL